MAEIGDPQQGEESTVEAIEGVKTTTEPSHNQRRSVKTILTNKVSVAAVVVFTAVATDAIVNNIVEDTEDTKIGKACIAKINDEATAAEKELNDILTRTGKSNLDIKDINHSLDELRKAQIRYQESRTKLPSSCIPPGLDKDTASFTGYFRLLLQRYKKTWKGRLGLSD